MKSSNAMQLDVFELAKRGQVREGALEMAALPRLSQSQAGQPAEPAPPALIEFRFEGFLDEQRRPSAQLALRGEIDLACDRCGKPLRWPLATDARYFFVHSEDELGRLPVDDSEEEPLLGSARFDLHALIEDEAILALPMSPRHASCEIAVDLSAGLSAADIPPAEPERPHPFAQLEKLKSRRN
jgi:uncharacterized protein